MFRYRKSFFFTGFLLLCLYNTYTVKAQSVTENPVELEIQESAADERVISHVLKITNVSRQPFNGTLLLDSLSDLRPLIPGVREISMVPGDTLFFAYKFMVDKEIVAGRKNMRYIIRNELQEKVLERKVFIDIEEREQLLFVPDDIPVMVIHPEDSVRVSVTVSNNGNTSQEVLFVFNIPNLQESPLFTEMNIVLAPMELKRVVHSFIPSSNLFSTGQFPVHITAMKGKEKAIFGNTTVTVQHVYTNRKYVDIFPSRGFSLGSTGIDNTVSLSYRQYNALSNMLQLDGGGTINLPAGYLYLKGSIYKYNSGQNPMITNTSLMYKYEENELTIGNVSEQTELPIYGRGVKAILSSGNGKEKLTFGAVDQNFNLIDSRPWFQDYYTFYLKGELGANNSDKGVKGLYIYQKNSYEKAIYNIGALQWRSGLGKNWDFHVDTYAALGDYEVLKGHRFSGAAELRYRGLLPLGLILDGSGYYSDGYFPGSRKGILSIAQGISKSLTEKMFLSASVGYNRSSPKSYTYHYTYRSENSYGNLMLTLPNIATISSTLYFRYQGESSPSYSSWLVDEGNDLVNIRIRSYRMGWQWRWQSPNTHHSLYGTLDGGLYSNPLGSNQKGQGKATLNYAYREVMIDATYQKGAYYLYEYMLAAQQDKQYNRFTASISIHKPVSKKISFSSGIHFSHDIYQGSVPSANFAAKYLVREKLSFFMNANWYKYRFNYTNNVYNMQVGVTWNFNRSQPLAGRKSRIIAQVYYDHNANNRYDQGDEPAEGYLLSVDNKLFISNKDGKVQYSQVPYGNYTIKSMQSGLWHFNRKIFDAESPRTTIHLPLKQRGGLKGNIRFIVTKNSVELLPNYGDIRFIIKNKDGEVEQNVISSAEGELMAFLPRGSYSISLDTETLPEYAECNNCTQDFRIEAGKTLLLDPFEINIKERKVNMKRFFASD